MHNNTNFKFDFDRTEVGVRKCVKHEYYKKLNSISKKFLMNSFRVLHKSHGRKTNNG